MSVIGMSRLLATMLAAGGPSRLDVHDHRRLHETLAMLASEYRDDLADYSLPSLETSPDPEVGVRVRGVTRGLWDLCAAGVLVSSEGCGQAEYVVDHIQLESQAASDLPVEIWTVLAHYAQDWRRALDTDLKNARQPA